MLKPIEVASFGDSQAINELAIATYSGQEPGFQIENVREIDELKLVFGSLVEAFPVAAEARDFRQVALQAGRISRIRAVSMMSTKPHTDRFMNGLAIHQNITGTIPVVLATSLVRSYESDNYDIDPSVALNTRSGQTSPGKLTIFSEGGYPWLKPTIHFFDRRAHPASNMFARYTQGGRYSIDNRIKKAFEHLNNPQ